MRVGVEEELYVCRAQRKKVGKEGNAGLTPVGCGRGDVFPFPVDGRRRLAERPAGGHGSARFEAVLWL